MPLEGAFEGVTMSSTTALVDEKTPPSLSSLDAFVGFIYAATIGLLLKVAHFEELFHSFFQATILLVVLGFFAQDWVVRFLGFKRMSGRTESSPLWAIGKILIDITVIFSLLLVFLQLIDNMGLGREQVPPVLAITEYEIYYKIAAFAICCGVWNYVMIKLSVQVQASHICTFVGGHLDEKIVELFPSITYWKKKYNVSMETLREKRRNAENAEEEKELRLAEVLTGVFKAVVLAATSPFHLIIPYFIVWHIVLLNYSLGLLLLVSVTKLEKASILCNSLVESHLPFSVYFLAVPVVLWALATAAVSVLLYAFHFGPNSKGRKIFERLASWGLLFTVIVFYLVMPAKWLAITVFAQQIFVNLYMTKNFRPESAPAPLIHQQEAAKGA